jgi:parvulin-like peptidyl-prolyl isomerase
LVEQQRFSSKIVKNKPVDNSINPRYRKIMANKLNSLKRLDLMPILPNNKIISVSLFYFFISASVVTFAVAHSGHTHEEKLRISLPDVVAKVNDQDILSNDILKNLRKALKNYKDRGIPLSIEEEKISAKKLIQDQIGQALLLQKGKELGVNITDSILAKQIKKIKSSYKSDAIFEHELKNQKVTFEQFKKDLKVDLVMQHVIDREIKPNIKINDKEIESFYEKNKDKFITAKKARASVILIKAKQGDTKAAKSARQKIESILEGITNGSSFSEMAIKHSEDSLAPKGGDLGYFAKNQIFGAFSERAFNMKINEVSPIFKTGLGLHLLKLTDLKKGKTMALDEAKTKIENILRKKKVGNATRNYVESLKQKSKIKMYF